MAQKEYGEIETMMEKHYRIMAEYKKEGEQITAHQEWRKRNQSFIDHCE